MTTISGFSKKSFRIAWLIIWMSILSLPIARADGKFMSSENQAPGTKPENEPPEAGQNSIHRSTVTFTNPQRFAVPEVRVQILHQMVQEVVAEHLRLRAGHTGTALQLVLGEDLERFKLGGGNEADTIYLKKWDEMKFEITDIQLAVQRMVVIDRWERMADEISNRTDRIVPVSAQNLLELKGVHNTSPTVSTEFTNQKGAPLVRLK